jgi:ferredoxin
MQTRELLRFHLTGERPPGADGNPAGIRPALLAPFRDLASLRYDYPLVLLEGGDSLTVTLSELFNDILRRTAPAGPAGERMRRHALRLEQRIRRRVTAGESDLLSQLWESAAGELATESTKEEAKLLQDSLDKALGALAVDGRVVDCDDRLAETFIEHAWAALSREQARRMRQQIDRLSLRLSDILKADEARSRAGLGADKLAGSVGNSYRKEFDFDAWSQLVTRQDAGGLGADRRRRIENTLSVLENQQFVPGGKKKPHTFRFDSCAEAAASFHKRVPEMLELVRAIAVARLEIENRYVEDRHDAFFAAHSEAPPASEDIADFPSYLVCLREKDLNENELAHLVAILSSNLPIKVLVETADVLGADGGSGGHQPQVGGKLANLALGLGEAFVMQSTSSSLGRLEQAVMAGFWYQGPGLFNVFSPSSEHSPDLPPYLTSAAAARSRAFPAFTYDPAAGDEWADRFRVDINPQIENDWPVGRLSYEDDKLQRVTAESRFTFVDFAACDSRHSNHFLTVPRSSWSDAMEPAVSFLNGDAPAGKVPYVVVATVDNELLRLVVNVALIETARRCRRRWNSLRELGGVHNSHVRRLLEQERAQWEEQKARELMESSTAVIEADQPAAELEAAPVPEEAPTEEVAEEPPDSDEPYIETARCTTCDECTKLNPRMFAYDDNKQAYIADLGAGSYREMVEAAEACQVAIIHPGKPWDPSEPDLERLTERAAAFA